ncbi:hypothetical protein HYW76_04200 [Candidatus Pacearchaeota archaeon]|nr:hypothetical protein [Candidatus Pacearchaeota archaeon]
MRKEFGKLMAELVRNDKRVYVIAMDFCYGIFNDLEKENPSHLINTGITEQASVNLATGMALEGLKPYVFSIVPFVLERPFEQIKMLMEHKADVKLIGYWDYPEAGPTHFTKDVPKICECLGIKLYEPKDSEETRKLLLETYNTNEPAFFYLRKNKPQQIQNGTAK